MWLENMLPYLRVKKQKATEAITFGKSFLRTNLSLDIVHKILKSKEKGCKLSKRLNISPASVSTIRKRHGILKKDCKE